MIAKPKPRTSWLSVLMLLIAIAIWTRANREIFSDRSPAPDSQAAARHEKSGGYEVYRNCTLAAARNNDGDSFMVRLPDGKQAEFRLYFVDTPESAFKSYAGGETNRKRIADQAAEMGGITPEQAVEIGKAGKHFTLELLASHPFDIYTRWDSPFHDDRYHAHVEVQQDDRPRWLDELLVGRGLARIKTKPADMPDGTPVAKHLADLRNLQRAAQQAKRGVWSF